MATLEVAADVLRRGDVLGIYPEGTRSRDGQVAPRSHRRGPAGADVRGPDRARRHRRDRAGPAGRSTGAAPFRRAVVRFGAPLDPRPTGIAAPPSPAHDRRPDGGDPAAQRPDRSAPTSPATSRRWSAAGTRACTRSTRSAASAPLGSGGAVRRRVGRPGSSTTAGWRVERMACRRRRRRRRTVRHRARGVGQVRRGGRMNESTYQVIELIGSSSDSWELAAQNAVRQAATAYKRPAASPRSWRWTC